ncbi:MAG: CCA tRNA nucleotidyltransferase [Planctomycetaceae bacterium]|nr:CCA tRNA nucleotidyltransferase [Planctomycetaceae bacterium]MCP4465059.1 CCA tRNA nucleotidyltransferase [Planctomycetaceae bacterium]
MSPREFAYDVTKRLQEAGFQAFWAGGCVRDQLLHKQPKDYDVATSATPAQIAHVFGERKTLELGVAFGVITVIGTKQSGNIEVATFRCDSDYSDGRRPDSIEYSTPEMDAHRRDFTINGLFFDPLQEKIVDFVGGQNDLERGLVKAIGDPAQRIAEDKLRMLRAVRFAANLDFQLDPATKLTIERHASEIVIVSVERIAVELNRMLVNEHRRRAVELLIETGLLTVILPELTAWQQSTSDKEQVLSHLAALESPDFSVALAALTQTSVTPHQFSKLAKRLKLANHFTETGTWVLKNAATLSRATELPWSDIQPLLIQPACPVTLGFIEAQGVAEKAVRFCRERLAWPQERLNPSPLLDGNVLKKLGIEAGPAFARILTETRNAQLNGEISTQAEAIVLAQQLSNR